MARKIRLKISKKIFNAVYIPFLQCFTRIQIFFGGSSSGKSVFLAQRCVLDIFKGGRNYLCVRKVGKTLRNSVYNEILKAIDSLKLSSYFNTPKSDMTITCFNGYQILFGGLDDVEKLKSITPQQGVITDIWVEEATETDYADVKQLRKRLRGKSIHKKRLTLSFNPILQSHWIYNEYFSNWDDSKNFYQDDYVSILRTTYKDNKFLMQDDIDDLENEPDQYYKDVYTYGKWGILGSVIFKNWRTEDLTQLKAIADKFKNGLDFGYGEDPAALAHTYFDRKHKTIYVFDDSYWKHYTNDILASSLKPIIGNMLIVADSSEPKSIQELNNHGIRAIGAKKGKDSVNFGIQWLQQQTIVVDIHCQNAKNELQQYKWKEDKSGNVLPEPVDKNNHFIDALRYAYEDEMGIGQRAGTWGR
jgi:phage terminase large subunit